MYVSSYNFLLKPFPIYLILAWSAVIGSAGEANARTIILDADKVIRDIWTTSVFSGIAVPQRPGGGRNDETLQVGGWGDEYRSLIQFDLSGVPKQVSTATLELFNVGYPGTHYSPVGMNLDRVTSDWDWTSKTIDSGTLDNDRLWWVDRPTYMPVISSLAPPAVMSTYKVDVTNVVNGQLNGTYENYGIQLRPTSTWKTFNNFASSEHTNKDWRPKLILDIPPAVPTIIPRPVVNIPTETVVVSPETVPGSKRGLIVISHGYLSNATEVNGWAQSMKNAISSDITSKADTSTSWKIMTVDWASMGIPILSDWSVVNNAITVGSRIGGIIANEGYDFVHLIGHSAGSWVVQSAASQIANFSPSTKIHSTFLDAYAASGYGPGFRKINGVVVGGLGSTSDWSEHYYNELDLPGTSYEYKNTFNINVSLRDHESFIDGHGYPHQWYISTVNDPLSLVPSWGYGTSLESGNALPLHGDFRRGDCVAINKPSCGVIDNAVINITEV